MPHVAMVMLKFIIIVMMMVIIMTAAAFLDLVISLSPILTTTLHHGYFRFIKSLMLSFPLTEEKTESLRKYQLR